MKIVASVIALALVVVGAWFFYDKYVNYTPIGDIVSNPREYDGKMLIIEGKVTERLSLLAIKSFVVQDETGEIKVITTNVMPEIGSHVRIRGSVHEAFSLGNLQVLVFKEAPKD